MTTATGQREAGPYKAVDVLGKPLVVEGPQLRVPATKSVERLAVFLNAAYSAGVASARSPATGEVERLAKLLRQCEEELGFNDPEDRAFESDLAGEVRWALAAFSPRAGGGK